ncbi:hypothetical protein ACFVTF_24515 [Kitasatospora sp. NPDC057940]|uniref:hypothetical protein n=1 Tax=Kitasatospora sp. NPDC057940 TaxID=3346285 RepID=UPI0036DE17B3
MPEPRPLPDIVNRPLPPISGLHCVELKGLTKPPGMPGKPGKPGKELTHRAGPHIPTPSDNLLDPHRSAGETDPWL